MKKRLLSAVLSGTLVFICGFPSLSFARRLRFGKPTPAEEAQISREVRHELIFLPNYTLFDSLTYQIQGRTVTLSGLVTTPSLKTDAEVAVKSIGGVEQVTNTIQLLPRSLTDDQIRIAQARAIFDPDTGLPRYGLQNIPSIHIIVINGEVTLAGLVQSDDDKVEAEALAKSVLGTSSVSNELRVAED